jgi:hypothetical protein
MMRKRMAAVVAATAVLGLLMPGLSHAAARSVSLPSVCILKDVGMVQLQVRYKCP